MKKALVNFLLPCHHGISDLIVTDLLNIKEFLKLIFYLYCKIIIPAHEFILQLYPQINASADFMPEASKGVN